MRWNIVVECGPYASGFRDIDVVSAAPAQFGARFRKSSRDE